MALSLHILTLLFDCGILLLEKADVSVTGKVPILVLPVEISAFFIIYSNFLTT